MHWMMKNWMEKCVTYWLRHILQRETCDPPLPHHSLPSCKSTKRLESRIQEPQHSHPPTCPMCIVPLFSNASLARNCLCTIAEVSSMARWTQPWAAARWGTNLCQGSFWLLTRKKDNRKGCQALEKASQGSDGIHIWTNYPGATQL